jgi:Arc/MetJ-type ribon-helix-helix transcriptional regulator
MAKVMISLPDDLLDRIDQEVERRHSSRSALLQQAARRELGWPDPVAIDAAVARARKALAGAGSFESAALVRAERDARHVGA